MWAVAKENQDTPRPNHPGLVIELQDLGCRKCVDCSLLVVWLGVWER